MIINRIYAWDVLELAITIRYVKHSSLQQNYNYTAKNKITNKLFKSIDLIEIIKIFIYLGNHYLIEY